MKSRMLDWVTQSPIAQRVVGALLHTRIPGLRFGALLLLSACFYLRCWRLFCRWGYVIIALVALSSGALGFVAIGALIGLALELRRQPALNIGHRAGAEGFAGAFCENTLPAARALIAQDNGSQGPLAHFHYLEFDVHETRDGELVVLHDLASVMRASMVAPVNDGALRDLGGGPLPLLSLSVGDVTLEEIQRVHVRGTEGLRVPTLEQFLQVCEEEGLCRSLAVEIKSIRSDEARSRLIRLLTGYREGCERRSRLRGEASACYPPFGWVGVIAFPWVWAACFGEFGTATWRRWGREFRQAKISTRSCVTHCLDFTSGLD
eukprot:jgi/Botrbrau1/15349/Bobra.0289s0005.1